MKLLIKEGPNSGQELDLEGSSVLGRDPASATLVIEDPEASRRHASLTPGASGVVVEDLGSTNGTFVNGERVEGQRDCGVGDEIRIGNTVLVVQSAVEATRMSPVPEPADPGATAMGDAPPTDPGPSAPEPPAPEPPASPQSEPGAAEPPPAPEPPAFEPAAHAAPGSRAARGSAAPAGTASGRARAAPRRRAGLWSAAAAGLPAGPAGDGPARRRDGARRLHPGQPDQDARVGGRVAPVHLRAVLQPLLDPPAEQGDAGVVRWQDRLQRRRHALGAHDRLLRAGSAVRRHGRASAAGRRLRRWRAFEPPPTGASSAACCCWATATSGTRTSSTSWPSGRRRASDRAIESHAPSRRRRASPVGIADALHRLIPRAPLAAPGALGEPMRDFRPATRPVRRPAADG